MLTFLACVALGEPDITSSLEPRAPVAAQRKKHAPKHYHKVVIAHGVMASLAWVIIFPSGSIFMRVLPNGYAFKVHAFFQSFGIILYIAAVGMGIWMGRTTDKLDNYHTILGLVIFGLVAFQVIAGAIHHWVIYKKTHKRSNLARIHLWLGRILITAGMINGGLGFKLSSPDWHYGVKVASTGDIVAYSILCVLFWLAYILIVVYYEVRPGPSGGTVSDSDSDGMQEVKRELRTSRNNSASLKSGPLGTLKKGLCLSRNDDSPRSQV